jgi:VWFA-related protein
VRRYLASLLLLLAAFSVVHAEQAAEPARPVFHTSVDRVTVATTVRTKHGKPVTNLKPNDFELFDSGHERSITDFRSDATPVNIAMLVDFSGSMDVAAKRQAARDNAAMFLANLTPGVDQAGLYVFDKSLRELQPLEPAPGNVLAALDAASRPFGATSLFDAIAETGRRLAATGGARRAVVAFTDGADNASLLTAGEVSGIASSIDVPVYVILVVSPLDRSGDGTMDDAALTEQIQGALGNLARWTGGDIYAGIGPSESSKASHEIVSELRQQYLIAFEPDSRPGWHPIDVRTRDKDLVVRARSGYIVREQPGT